jgi:hypothetical protein
MGNGPFLSTQLQFHSDISKSNPHIWNINEKNVCHDEHFPNLVEIKPFEEHNASLLQDAWRWRSNKLGGGEKIIQFKNSNTCRWFHKPTLPHCTIMP